jgi:hypothetical protein
LADPKHLEILNEGAHAWDLWRNKHPEIQPDLSRAEISGKDFSGISLDNVNLSGAHLTQVNLRDAHLHGANLRRAFLSRINLERAIMSKADFRNARLSSVNFSESSLDATDFQDANFAFVVFASVDLSESVGLQTVTHGAPSTLGIDTLYFSKARIPEIFLRGCGVPEDFIVFARSLLSNPIEYYSCFISYSGKDQEFAERLHADLQIKGVRCWFASEDLKIGQRLRTSFDEAIRLHDKLMVILSAHSVSSVWVEKEVETAFEKERQQSRTVLFPICLDDAVMKTQQAWAADIRRTRHIGDFRDWKTHASYKKSFDRLLRDLRSKDEARSEVSS